MHPEFAGTGRTLPLPCRTDLEQLPNTPARCSAHRRAHSESFFHFPDLDDIVMDDLNLDHPQTPPPSLVPTGPPPPLPKPVLHFRSLSVDANFFNGLPLEASPPLAPAPAPAVPMHGNRNPMDGESMATSSAVESSGNKVMPPDRLQEIALIDPKRAKRILANRQSAARSKERKANYTNELEKKVQALQSEATQLSARITVLQRNTSGLTSENKELKLKLQALKEQAHLRDALDDTLRDELKRLKITSVQVPGVNGNNRGSPS